MHIIYILYTHIWYIYDVYMHVYVHIYNYIYLLNKPMHLMFVKYFCELESFIQMTLPLSLFVL